MIRKALPQDVQEIHSLGQTIPELRVSDSCDFMTQDELSDAIIEAAGIFFVSILETLPESRLINGFAYARVGDLDRAGGIDQACFVYLAVRKEDRHRGIGDKLCRRVLGEMIRRGVQHVYTWAHPTSGVIEFMERQGFTKGHTCVWMDRRLTFDDQS
jgi:N-acetylglutamate synthase-like GNAT family acetyltransferase